MQIFAIFPPKIIILTICSKKSAILKNFPTPPKLTFGGFKVSYILLIISMEKDGVFKKI